MFPERALIAAVTHQFRHLSLGWRDSIPGELEVELHCEKD